MEMITLRYKGSRSFVKAYYNRQAHIFKKANDFTADVPIVLGKRLLATRQYLPVYKVVVVKEAAVQETPTPVKFVCDICEFEAKSAQGLLVHKAKHK